MLLLRTRFEQIFRQILNSRLIRGNLLLECVQLLLVLICRLDLLDPYRLAGRVSSSHTADARLLHVSFYLCGGLSQFVGQADLLDLGFLRGRSILVLEVQLTRLVRCLLLNFLKVGLINQRRASHMTLLVLYCIASRIYLGTLVEIIRHQTNARGTITFHCSLVALTSLTQSLLGISRKDLCR